MITDRRRLLRGFVLAPWACLVAPAAAGMAAGDAAPAAGGYARPELLAEPGWFEER